MVAESIIGIQQQGVISTVKHYSLNCNETNRHWLDAVIDPDAHRESDLLAFEIAIERAQPGAVMAAYNKVNGVYAAANGELINEVLKGAWGYRGWVMSDWGGTPGWSARWVAWIRSAAPRSMRSFGNQRHSAIRCGPRTTRAASQSSPLGDGPTHPAVDVRGRCRSLGAGTGARHGCPRRGRR